MGAHHTSSGKQRQEGTVVARLVAIEKSLRKLEGESSAGMVPKRELLRMERENS